MKVTRRKFVGMCAKAGILASGIGLAGCLQKPPIELNATAAPKLKGNFIDGASGGDAETVNWILAGDATSFSYIGLTMDGLGTYDNKFNFLLRWLKKDVEVSDDGLIYTLTIRDDLEWSDGNQVTSDDFVYTMKNLMFADWMAYTYAGDWQEEVDGKNVFIMPRIENETTFSITRKTAYPEFLYTVYGLLAYPKHIVSKYAGNIKEFTQASELNNLSYTGNLGPYRFKEWIRSDKFVAERNPDYYLGKDEGEPYFETYTVKLFGTSAARHAAMEAGDVTSTLIEPEQARKFKEMKGIAVYTVPTKQYQIMQYNMRDNGWPGLKDKRIRQAISMAVSKDAIINQIRLGFGEPAFSFIPEVSPWYAEDGLMKFGVGDLYDKNKSRELFLEAGYGVKKEGKIELRNKDGSQINLKLVTNTGSKVAESTAFLVKQELGELGIDVEIKLVPWETELRKYFMTKVPGSDQEPRPNNGPKAISEETWDFILSGQGVDPLAPSNSWVWFSSNGGQNSYGYSNKKIDDLFAKVRTKEALGKDVRKEIYNEISRILSEDQPVNFMNFPTMNYAYDSRVKGIDPGISIGYNYNEWYFKS
ncbi:MAG: ABC transporter substrate-binding protein [Candidatus Methanoperedens sp.]|nr:ABC transporter substrate-binding protein [Candidatus Methanoperedens sp.]MCZ7371594.1 ABC transporter substrate-binding protein [Candidatus Methanoperedens sp.]